MVATASGMAAAIALLTIPSPGLAVAQARTGARIEGGISSVYVRPLEIEATPGGTLCAALDRRLGGSALASCELAATVGRDFTGAKHIDGTAAPGWRTLTTFLIGVEMIDPATRAGHFVSLGVGIGHSTLSDAQGSSSSGISIDLPPRSTTAFAVGAGIGYRFRGGPGVMKVQAALRAHALIDAGAFPANTYSFLLGLAH